MENSLVAGFQGGGQHPDLLFFALGIPETSSLSFVTSCADALTKLSNSAAKTKVSVDDRCMTLSPLI